MNNQRVRFNSSGRPAETLSVDYKDVLNQAVENERWLVLREVRRSLETIKTTKPSNYDIQERKATDFKDDLLKSLDLIEKERRNR
jgi:hypothetical protein